MGPGETFVGIVAIIAVCWMIASMAKHASKWLGGAYSQAESDSLSARELDRLVRAAVREETQALHAEIRRLERAAGHVRRIEVPEYSHGDLYRGGLLAEAEPPAAARGERSLTA